MKAQLGWLVAIAGAGAVALSAAAQGPSKLAVGPGAGGYLCPDGRQLYVKSCYDNSADATCGVVNMHLPVQNGFQRENTETRSKLTPSVAACKVYPVEFRNDGTVALVVPKSPSPQQTAKSPAAAPAPSPAVPTIPGPATRTALIRISGPGVAKTVHYVDEASAKPTGQKDVVEIWALQVFPNGDPDIPNANAVWTRYDIDCKKNTDRLRVWGTIDRQGKVLSAKSTDIVKPVIKNSPVETIAAVACKSTPLGGSRMLTVAAAIADADNAAAPKTAAKPATPAAKAVAVAPAAKAPIRLPETEVEKAFFEAIKSNMFQTAINAVVRSPGGTLPTLGQLTDNQGMTALHWAAANRSAAMTRWLVDKGVEVDLADENGRTPLKIALDNKDRQIMTVLLNIGGAYAERAWPGHDAELKGFKNTDDLVDFMIKNAAPAAAATKPNAAAQAQQAFLEGGRLFAQGDEDAALAAFAKAAKLDPTLRSAWLRQGQIHFNRFDFDPAIPFYERAIELDPDDIDTADQLCTAYILSDAPPDKGIAACERRIKLNPKDAASGHSAIARLQQRKGDNQKALVSALEWARLAPGESYAWTTLADIYVALRRNSDALAAVQKAVKLHPDDWSSLAKRGDIFRRLGKFTESIADYKAGIAIWPEGPELHHDLSVVLRAAGRKSEADAEQRLAIDYALSNGRNGLKKPTDGSPLSIGLIISAKAYLEMLEKWDKSAAAKLAAEIKAAER